MVAWHDSVNNQIGITVNNGTPEFEPTTGVPTSNPSIPFHIGYTDNIYDGTYWQGRIDEVGYWKRLLTPAERTALWAGGAGMTYPFLPVIVPTLYIAIVNDFISVGDYDDTRIAGVTTRIRIAESETLFVLESRAAETYSLIAGLVSFWPLNEASGSAIDLHGSTNLLVNPAALGAPTSAAGKVGPARDFEQSTSQHFSAPSGAALTPFGTPFTISAWVKAESIPVAVMGIVGRGFGVYYENHQGFQLVLDGTRSPPKFALYTLISGEEWDPDYGRVWYGDITPVVGTWYHVVAWCNPADFGEMAIAVNGDPDSWNSFGPGPATDDPAVHFVIGSYLDTPSNHFNGVIDEVGFWNRILTDKERAILYNNGKGVAYPFDQFALNALPALINVGDGISVTSAFVDMYRSLPGTTPLRGFGDELLLSDSAAVTLRNRPTLLTNLVAYWWMDEESGDALDAVGSSHLSPVGEVRGFLPGRVNTARGFSGESHLQRISGEALSLGDFDFTFSAWAKLEVAGFFGTILGRRDIANSDIKLSTQW